jgi:hypothetical protein
MVIGGINIILGKNYDLCIKLGQQWPSRQQQGNKEHREHVLIHRITASPSVSPIAPPIAIWVSTTKLRSHRRPIKHRHRFKPNKIVGNPMPALLRGVRIGSVDTLIHVEKRPWGPSASQTRVFTHLLPPTRSASHRSESRSPPSSSPPLLSLYTPLV